MTVSLRVLEFNNTVPVLQASPHNFGISGLNCRGSLLFSAILNNKDALEELLSVSFPSFYLRNEYITLVKNRTCQYFYFGLHNLSLRFYM